MQKLRFLTHMGIIVELCYLVLIWKINANLGITIELRYLAIIQKINANLGIIVELRYYHAIIRNLKKKNTNLDANENYAANKYLRKAAVSKFDV